MNRYAILADIHGNIWALEAVLANARHRSIRSFINLGDTLYGPLELAAYTDDDPPHIMENISPHARYAILEKTTAGWLVEQISVSMIGTKPRPPPAKTIRGIGRIGL